MSEENVPRARAVCAEFTNSRGQKVKGQVVGDLSRERAAAAVETGTETDQKWAIEV